MDIINSNPICCNAMPNTPAQIREFYNSTTLLSQGITGKGITIAIIDAFGDPNIQSELQTFDQTFGLPNPPSFNVLCIDGPCNYTSGIVEGWSPEIAIDVEWAHAMAPGANINLYIASNSSDPLYDADLAAVIGASGTGPSGSGIGTPGVYTNNVISNSWGEPENDYTASQSCTFVPCQFAGYPWIDQVFQEAAHKGISVFASSGDAGAFDQGDGFYQSLPYGGIEVPSDDPFVTAVGGTSAYPSTTSGSYGFVVNGSIPGGAPFTPVGKTTVKETYGYEVAWNWLNDYGQRPGYSAATSGGFSSLFGQPAYEHGPGIPDSGVRAVPDVAWDADPHTGAMIYGNNGGVIGWYEFGGTSLGAPSWAGVTALLDQSAGRSLGLLNPIFYSILNNPAEYSKAFHQVTYGNNNGYSAHAGWNPTTGIGTPNIGELADVINSMYPSLKVTVKNNLQEMPVQPEVATPAYAYGQTVILHATINGGMKVSGPVLANITSQNGVLLATNLPLSWDSATWSYVGSYTIKQSDPAGEWGADVLAINNKESGLGYNEFQVGDGLAVYSPLWEGPATNVFTVGQTIPLQLLVENPTDTAYVVAGHYKATFYLNTLGGKFIASVPLKYNASAGFWEGAYTIPKDVPQGSWVVAFGGVDDKGNWAAISYSWVVAGIFIWPFTNSYFYVQGQTMQIYAISTSVTGTMKSTLSYDGMIIRTVHMEYNATSGLWQGSTTLPSNGPTGFYNLTTYANDGMGDHGSNSEVISIQSALSVSLSISKKVIPVANGRTDFTVSIKNANGMPVTVGTVYARINYTYSNGTSVLTLRVPLVYNAAKNAWLGSFNTNMATNLASGKYTVWITAFDPVLEYGQAVGKFTIK